MGRKRRPCLGVGAVPGYSIVFYNCEILSVQAHIQNVESFEIWLEKHRGEGVCKIVATIRWEELSTIESSVHLNCISIII